MSVVVLTGGVGGAKLVRGMSLGMPNAKITAIVNTGDDFRHLGLSISPDIDTLLYTLSDRANLAQGWGRADETWNFMRALRELGGEDWFQLGDGDLALHVMRSLRLAAGDDLSTITQAFADAWSLSIRVIPMSNQPVATILDTDQGLIDFQQYFVKRKCVPVVRFIRFEGAGEARPATGVIEAILEAEAVLIAPSNPFLSIDPILSLPAIRDALCAARAPVVAVSPIVGGEAIKGPTAKLMRELGLAVTNATIANHYFGVIDGLLIHEGDDLANGSIAVDVTNTLMRDDNDKIRVARSAVSFAQRLARL